MAKKSESGDQAETAVIGIAPGTVETPAAPAGPAVVAVEPPAVVAVEAPAIKRWQLSPKTGVGGPEMVVEAATIEDAIRLYNGANTSFALKQLNIKAI